MIWIKPLNRHLIPSRDMTYMLLILKSMQSINTPYSQFAIALRYRDTIGLSETQINSLYNEVDNLKRMKNEYYELHGTSYDTREYESSSCTEILTSAQYDLLLRFKNARKAKSFAESDWTELEQRSMDAEYDKEVVLEELTEYYIVRQSIYDKYRHDFVTQKAEGRGWYLDHCPEALKALIKVRRSPLNDTINQGFNGDLEGGN